MKRVAALVSVLMMIAPIAYGQTEADKAPNPTQLFYKGNAYYESRDYAKAVESYRAAIDRGVESGRLYYNMGNGFFKLGKLGLAVLSYEKARRLTPRDSDLKSNLEYAKSLVPDAGYEIPRKRLFVRLMEVPFRSFSMNTLTAISAGLYLILLPLVALSLFSPGFGRRMRYVILVTGCIFCFMLTAFGIRFYDEEFLRHGIVIQAEADCKYEPIDNSTTYYKLGEGSEVIVLKTRNGWRQIRRLDGKIGWVKGEAVEEI